MVELQCAWCEDSLSTTAATPPSRSKRLLQQPPQAIAGASIYGTTHGICESCRVGTRELMRIAAESRRLLDPWRGGSLADDDPSK